MNPAFHHRRDDGAHVLVSADAVDAYSPSWFEDGVDDGSHARDPLAGGRGNVRIVDSAVGPLVHRHYLRGGLPRHVIRDRYVWLGASRTRSFHELVVLDEARRRGVRVPLPVAARYRRHGPLYRADLLTRLIPQARTLAQELSNADAPDALLGRVADAIAAMHEAGVWHADLNTTNVLVDVDGLVWLIDFDRAQLDVRDERRLSRNLDRLSRSIRKLLPASQASLIDAAWPQMLARYREQRSALSLRSP